PEASGDVLVLVIKWTEFGRAQPLYVPCVEIFVARQLEPAEIRTTSARGPAVRHQHRRVLVLETATGFGDHVEEDVAVVRQKSPEPAVSLADAPQPPRRPATTKDAPPPNFYERVLLPVPLEVVPRRIANDDGRAHYGVVIRSPVGVLAAV